MLNFGRGIGAYCCSETFHNTLELYTQLATSVVYICASLAGLKHTVLYFSKSYFTCYILLYTSSLQMKTVKIKASLQLLYKVASSKTLLYTDPERSCMQMQTKLQAALAAQITFTSPAAGPATPPACRTASREAPHLVARRCPRPPPPRRWCRAAPTSTAPSTKPRPETAAPARRRRPARRARAGDARSRSRSRALLAGGRGGGGS